MLILYICGGFAGTKAALPALPDMEKVKNCRFAFSCKKCIKQKNKDPILRNRAFVLKEKMQKKKIFFCLYI